MKRATTQAEWEQQMVDYVTRRNEAMAQAGVEPGDIVEWHNVVTFAVVEILRGTLYISKKGQPKVKVVGDRRQHAWHKGLEEGFQCVNIAHK